MKKSLIAMFCAMLLLASNMSFAENKSCCLNGKCSCSCGCEKGEKCTCKADCLKDGKCSCVQKACNCTK